MTIFISAGHYNESRGAHFEDFYEYPETVYWATQIVRELQNKNLKAEFAPVGSLSEKIHHINHANPDVAVEIHFNADTKQAGKGSETLYCPGSSEGKKFAELVQDELAELFEPSRGVKEGWYQLNPEKGPDRFLKYTACPAIIVEPEFVHHKRKIIDNRKEGCKAIARGIFRYVTRAS